ncbi:hypothetical protein M231_01505 [Tremella mesenterica]|uniref:RRM domain-containing protein n=1 Tax=Tremella mesenterica TaxID=5217 RepID=A0A4Q1BT64_TREME|nr:hypothetical protein M231_01505 [Tremella mesenterica]
MSSMDIDQPLEDIIKAKGRTKKGKNGGKLQSRGNIQPRARHPAPAKATPVPKARPVGAEASKIIISNLPGDVNEAAVRDLMQSTVGPVKSVQLHYTSAGKSTGVATVLFRNKGDGNKAHAAYHNRMVDNR